MEAASGSLWSLFELRQNTGFLYELLCGVRGGCTFLQPGYDLLLLELDLGRILERVVRAEYVEETAVARRPRISGHDTVVRPLVRSLPRQPDLHCHPITSLVPIDGFLKWAFL